VDRVTFSNQRTLSFCSIGTVVGLKPTAVMLSICASIKRQGMNPWVYLKHALTELPARSTEADLTDLLPDVWTCSRAGPAAVAG